MTLYGLLKNVHVFCVVITGLLFAYRFYRLQRFPRSPLNPALKVVPHINDTVLLSAAIGMLVILGLNPFRVPWLSIKIIVLVAYIGLGVLCLRAVPGSRKQTLFFVLAAILYLSIVAVALTRGTTPSV